MPGELEPPKPKTRAEHAMRAQALLVSAARADQSHMGFHLATARATEALAHAALAKLPDELLGSEEEEGEEESE